MSLKMVIVAVVIAVAFLTAADAFIVYELTGPASYAGHTAARALALAVAAIAAVVAAVRFNGFAEHVGRAWTLLATLYVLLTISYVLTRTDLAGSTTTQIMVIVGNLAAVGAFWLFGTVLRNSGLQFYGPAALKLAVFVIAVAIACALVLPTVLQLLDSERAGIEFVAELVSAAADMLTFILVAPLLLTVWSFRGGKLSWVYGFLALSTVGWMVNQAADDLLPQRIVRDTQMLGLFLACASVAVAAYLQQASTRTEPSRV